MDKRLERLEEHEMRRLPFRTFAVVLVGCVLLSVVFAQNRVAELVVRKSVANRVDEFGPAVKLRLEPVFKKVGVVYPPASLVFLGLKQEKRFEVWAPDSKGALKLVKSYPILAASGKPGPKLREGDLQVPEGLYQIESLNPNSAYHLSLRVNYPNAFDRAQAKTEGRTNLGGDIMIHGKAASVGCLAMGDPAAEELFVLAALAGVKNIRVILSPVDFRKTGLPPEAPKFPAWVNSLHGTLREQVLKLK